MGNCKSAEIQRQEAENKKIEKEFEISTQVASIKLILLGAAASGKSTILKQMIILQSNGFTKQEIEHKKLVIRDNSIDSMTSLLKAMIHLNIIFDNPELEVKAKDILVLSRNNIFEDMQMGNEIISGSISVALTQLWADKGVQKCYKRRNEFQLEDCTKHVLDNLERIWSPEYKPTNQDILYSRVRTTGVQEIQFQAQLRQFQVYDVGGQRSERRKWIHLFDIVNSVIFIAALSDYNIVMHTEDKEKNSLMEALELFEAVLGIEWFADKAMILFLNKKDLFEEKLELFPLKELFPEFEGGANYDHGISFLTKEFNQRNKSEMRQIYTHTTCATDTDQVEKVIDSVINLIIGLNAQKSGFE